MSIYPEDPRPIYPIPLTPVWNTAISGKDGGSEERTARWVFAKYDMSYKYELLTPAEEAVLYAFYMARKGSLEAFYAYDLTLLAGKSRTHAGLYVATADGAIGTFDIPGRSTSSQTLYIDGVADGTAAFLTGGGDANADRVTPTTTPAAGEILTVDFTGFLRNRCRFAQDKMTFELFRTHLYGIGIELKGLAAL